MAGADNVQFNTLERALSGDVNDLQSMAARELSEILREMVVRRSFTLGNVPGESPRSVILGGLEVSPSGSDIAVAVGSLAQQNSTLLPVPGSLDSSYRLAINRAIETLTGPVPGVETFFLIEAQMVNVVTSSQVRDIFNPATNLFTPTPVDKLVERQVDFQFVTGAAGEAPVPSGDPWVPIAIVRRPGGGGAVLGSDLYDVRLLWDAEAPQRDSFPFAFNIVANRGSRFLLTVGQPGAPASNSVVIAAEVYTDPIRLWYSRSGPLDVTGVEILSPGTVLVADTWYYLYLMPWQGLPLVSTRDPFATGRGILALSAVTTGAQGQMKNSLPVPLPPPFGVVDAPGAAGVVVAALRRNAGNTGWVPSWTVEDNEVRLGPALTIGSFSPLASPQTIALAGLVPTTAKVALVQLRIDGNGPSGTVGQVFIGPTGVVGSYRTAEFDDGGVDTFEFPLPLAGATTFDILYVGGAAPDVIAELVGYSE